MNDIYRDKDIEILKKWYADAEKSRKKLITKEYYVAYFDILGYKDVFLEEPNTIQDFLYIVKMLVSDTKLSLDFSNDLMKYEIKVFSDNFIIGFEPNSELEEKYYVSYICNIISSIQLLFLKKYQVLIRGGLTKGQLYFDDDFVFGQGLIDAYNLECSAQYPRVLIDSEVFKDVFKDNKTPLYGYTKDNDGEYIVDYLFGLQKSIIEGEDIRKQINLINNSIISIIKKKCTYPKNYVNEKAILEREKIIRKYLWVLDYHNEYYIKIGEEGFQINYQIHINNRILRPEIVLK